MTRRLRFVVAMLLLTSGATFGPVMREAAADGPPVTGSVFLDQNFNGDQDADETDPVDTSGLTLVAQDSAGNTATAVFTGNNYSIDVSGLAGTQFRLRFTADPTSLVYPAAASLAGGQTGIDYVDAGANVNFAVTDGPAIQCSDNPLIATTCARPNDPAVATVGAHKAIDTLNWNATGSSVVANLGDVGTLWGVAYDPRVTSCIPARWCAGMAA